MPDQKFIEKELELNDRSEKSVQFEERNKCFLKKNIIKGTQKATRETKGKNKYWK